MLQALALSLTNTTNAAMNKTAMFLAGITVGELTPCEGYIAKLQKRAARNLWNSVRTYMNISSHGGSCIGMIQ